MEHMHYNKSCKSKAPYPEIKVLEPNIYYATLLKEDYAGFVSEFSALTQYVYHSFVTERIDEEIAEMLECISIVEMHHLKILAKLIDLLGEKPVYCAQNRLWNGSYVDYGHHLLEQLQADLESEYQAINQYQYHITLIKDPYIQAVLKRIIEDEEVHVTLFKEAIAKIEKNKNK
ncbi:MAG: manganese catalase family protein [Bacilli bacterium]|nr:manganese catalase family protein [Bacilli bacterium]